MVSVKSHKTLENLLYKIKFIRKIQKTIRSSLKVKFHFQFLYSKIKTEEFINVDVKGKTNIELDEHIKYCEMYFLF